MTTVILELPDQVVATVERHARQRGLTLSQHVSELLAHTRSDGSTNGDELHESESMTILDKWLAAPLRVDGFRPLSREQAHER